MRFLNKLNNLLDDIDETAGAEGAGDEASAAVSSDALGEAATAGEASGASDTGRAGEAAKDDVGGWGSGLLARANAAAATAAQAAAEAADGARAAAVDFQTNLATTSAPLGAFGFDDEPPHDGDEDGCAVLDLSSFNAWRSANPGDIAQIKGFSQGLSDCYHEAALSELWSVRVLFWHGEPPEDTSFTSLVSIFLREKPDRMAVAFRKKDGVREFQENWKAKLEEYGDRIVVVAVDVEKAATQFELRSEVGNVADLSESEQEAYLLDRIAMKATGSRQVIAMGGGGRAPYEAEASFLDGVNWTVYALSRGSKEQQPSLMDWSAKTKSPNLSLVFGKDPSYMDAFASSDTFTEIVAEPTLTQQYKERLWAIYQTHNSSKLSDIEGLLARHKGREHALYERVCSKYKVVPEADLSSTSVAADVPHLDQEAHRGQVTAAPESSAHTSPIGVSAAANEALERERDELRMRVKQMESEREVFMDAYEQSEKLTAQVTKLQQRIRDEESRNKKAAAEHEVALRLASEEAQTRAASVHAASAGTAEADADRRIADADAARMAAVQESDALSRRVQELEAEVATSKLDAQASQTAAAERADKLVNEAAQSELLSQQMLAQHQEFEQNVRDKEVAARNANDESEAALCEVKAQLGAEKSAHESAISLAQAAAAAAADNQVAAARAEMLEALDSAAEAERRVSEAHAQAEARAVDSAEVQVADGEEMRQQIRKLEVALEGESHAAARQTEQFRDRVSELESEAGQKELLSVQLSKQLDELGQQLHAQQLSSHAEAGETQDVAAESERRVAASEAARNTALEAAADAERRVEEAQRQAEAFAEDAKEARERAEVATAAAASEAHERVQAATAASAEASADHDQALLRFESDAASANAKCTELRAELVAKETLEREREDLHRRIGELEALALASNAEAEQLQVMTEEVQRLQGCVDELETASLQKDARVSQSSQEIEELHFSIRNQESSADGTSAEAHASLANLRSELMEANAAQRQAQVFADSATADADRRVQEATSSIEAVRNQAEMHMRQAEENAQAELCVAKEGHQVAIADAERRLSAAETGSAVALEAVAAAEGLTEAHLRAEASAAASREAHELAEAASRAADTKANEHAEAAAASAAQADDHAEAAQRLRAEVASMEASAAEVREHCSAEVNAQQQASTRQLESLADRVRELEAEISQNEAGLESGGQSDARCEQASASQLESHVARIGELEAELARKELHTEQLGAQLEELSRAPPAAHELGQTAGDSAIGGLTAGGSDAEVRAAELEVAEAVRSRDVRLREVEAQLASSQQRSREQAAELERRQLDLEALRTEADALRNATATTDANGGSTPAFLRSMPRAIAVIAGAAYWGLVRTCRSKAHRDEEAEDLEGQSGRQQLGP